MGDLVQTASKPPPSRAVFAALLAIAALQSGAWLPSAPAWAGGNAAAPEPGGIPMPGPPIPGPPIKVRPEASIQPPPPPIYATPPPAYAPPPPAPYFAAPGSPDEIIVIDGNGTRVFSPQEYEAARNAPGDGLPGGRPFGAEPEKPETMIVEPSPQAEPAGPAMPVAPPVPAPPRAQAAAPAEDDGLGGFLSELRIGPMIHDVGIFNSSKEDAIDVNLEALFVSPDFFRLILSPRPMIGISANLVGDTSQLYGGLTWDWMFLDPFFVEAALALAVHDGETDGESQDEKALGCRLLGRESLSLGARVGENHSVSLSAAHISNFGLCDQDEGLDSVGFLYGYRF
jgi:hypothetical protein